MKDSVLNSFNSLEQYCKKEDFKGWDPYDGLTSKIFNALPILPNKRISRLIWIQLIKKLPFNLRGILRIEKGYNPKGLALFISGISKISQSRNSDAIQQINRLCEKVIELQTQGFSGSCWGYNFDWESRAFFQKKFTPTIVVTTYVSNALLDAYEATKNKDYLNLAISSKDFIIKDLKRTYNDNGNLAFSYSPFDSTSVFNASLLGAKLLSRIYTYTNEKELISLAKKAVAYCCDYQNADGSWFYSPLPFHQWIDNFHTGFNLECIYEYGLFAKDDSFEKNFNDGMSYYLKTFFDKEGRSKYYNNSLYPIDIHSPSQLIVTLAKTNLFAKNRKIIDRVVNWTIENMQSPKGYFYFQKRKFYTNKIPFMRWSEGWMFYGLAHYLQNTLEGEKAV